MEHRDGSISWMVGREYRDESISWGVGPGHRDGSIFLGLGPGHRDVSIPWMVGQVFLCDRHVRHVIIT